MDDTIPGLDDAGDRPPMTTIGIAAVPGPDKVAPAREMTDDEKAFAARSALSPDFRRLEALWDVSRERVGLDRRYYMGDAERFLELARLCDALGVEVRVTSSDDLDARIRVRAQEPTDRVGVL